MKKSGGTERVERYLRRYLRSLTPGEAMPSFRIVARECQVSAVTASAVVKEFEDSNLLTVRPQRGIFTPQQLTPRLRDLIKVRQIDILHVGATLEDQHVNPFRRDLILHLNEAPLQRGYCVRFHGISFGAEGLDQIRQIAAEKSVEACIVVRLSETGQLDPLREAHIPYVCVYPESPSVPQTNSVLIDQEAIPRTQIDYLRSLGHRRIGYIHNVEPHVFQRGLLVRRESFYRTALDLGLPIDSSIVQYGGYRPETQREGIERILSNPNPPTAIVCSDEHIAEVYLAARKRNLVIGRDLSVIGTNDDGIAASMDPPATTIYVPRMEAVNKAVDILEDVLCSVDAFAPNRFVNAELVVRQSTGPLNS